MTPEEKAKELVSKMKEQFFMEHDNVKVLKAKQCALICVDEMKKIESQILEGVPTDYVYTYEPDLDEVKQEINKL